MALHLFFVLLMLLPVLGSWVVVFVQLDFVFAFLLCVPIDVIRVLVTYIIKIGIHVDIVINTLITVTLM
jgi:hypothetical protein